jgi:hypothetical protein
MATSVVLPSTWSVGTTWLLSVQLLPASAVHLLLRCQPGVGRSDSLTQHHLACVAGDSVVDHTTAHVDRVGVRDVRGDSTVDHGIVGDGGGRGNHVVLPQADMSLLQPLVRAPMAHLQALGRRQRVVPWQRPVLQCLGSKLVAVPGFDELLLSGSKYLSNHARERERVESNSVATSNDRTCEFELYIGNLNVAICGIAMRLVLLQHALIKRAS